MQGGFSVLLGISLGVLVSLTAWSLVALRLAAQRRFDLIDIFLLSFGTIYGVGYAFIIHATEVGQNPGGFRILGLEHSYWIIPALALVCILACLTFTVLIGADSHCEADAKEHDEGAWHLGLSMVGWAFLAVATLASTLYTRAYGGFAGYFEVAGALRSGLFEEAGDNPLSFLKPFGGFSIFSTYVFAARWASAESGQRLGSIVGFALSFAITSVTLLGWGGRVDLLVYWATVVLGVFIYRFGVLPRLLGGASVLVLAMVILMPLLTDAMNPGKSRDSYTEFFAGELTFPVESSLNSLELPRHRYGFDIVVAPIFLLPERVWSTFDIRPVSDLNSELLLGDRLREGFGYTIPADFITFGLYQFDLAGPLIVALLWCFLLAMLDRFLILGFPRSLSAFLYGHAVFSIAAISPLYADPKMQLTRNLHFIFGVICVLAIPWLWGMARQRKGRSSDLANLEPLRRGSRLAGDPISERGR